MSASGKPAAPAIVRNEPDPDHRARGQQGERCRVLYEGRGDLDGDQNHELGLQIEPDRETLLNREPIDEKGGDGDGERDRKDRQSFGPNPLARPVQWRHSWRER